MKYVFFDIECCDGQNMCTFGYATTDEQFNITESEDVLINPEKKIKLSGKDDSDGFILKYDEEEIKSSPTFPVFYEKIKGILQDGDSVIFGFSGDNDANFIYTACNRYNLPVICYKYLDVQSIYKYFKEETNVKSLDKVCEEINCKTENLHRSLDDSIATMYALKYVLNELKITVPELVNKYQYITGGLDKEGSYKNRPVIIFSEIEFKDNTFKKNNKKFNRLLERLPSGDGILNGKIVKIDPRFTEKNFKETCKMAERIYLFGGEYVVGESEPNYYVKLNNAKKGSVEDEYNKKIKRGEKAELVNLDEFIRLLNFKDVKDLREAPLPETDINGRQKRKLKFPKTYTRKNGNGEKNVYTEDVSRETSISDLLKSKKKK